MSVKENTPPHHALAISTILALTSCSAHDLAIDNYKYKHTTPYRTTKTECNFDLMSIETEDEIKLYANKCPTAFLTQLSEQKLQIQAIHKKLESCKGTTEKTQNSLKACRAKAEQYREAMKKSTEKSEETIRWHEHKNDDSNKQTTPPLAPPNS